MDKLKSKWKSMLVLLYAAIVLLAAAFLDSYTVTEKDKLFLTPTFGDSMGWDIYTLKDGIKTELSVQELQGSTGETIYLSRKLDRELEDDGYTVLELDGTSWQVSVFLDDGLLYTVDPSLDNRIGFVEFPSEYQGIRGLGEYVRLSLPPDYSGKTLTLAAASNTALEQHGLPLVRLSSEDIQTQLLVSDANRIAMPAAAYMAAAVLLLGLFFYNWYHGQKACSLLLLILAALAQALRVLLNFEYYFSAHLSLELIPAELLVPLAFGLPALYLLAQMKRWKRWCAPCLLIPLVLNLIVHIMARVPVFAFLSAFRYDADKILYLPLLALTVFAVLEWKDRNTVYRLFTPAFLGAIALMILAAGLGDSVLGLILRAPMDMVYEALQRFGAILLILGGAVSLILTVRKTADTQSALAAMTVRNELMTENIQSMQESSIEIARLRHDMLRHLHTMLDLSAEGSSERLIGYLKELTAETEDILPIKVCQHPVVNALVTRADAKAKKEGIQMIWQVEVPADITVADNDLCVLLMNMLDNAIEAVRQLPKGEKRMLELTMHIRGRYLFIETINTCHGNIVTDEKTGLLISRKGDGHGYGMKAMSDVARKYKSKLQIMQESDTLVVRTALFMP